MELIETIFWTILGLGAFFIVMLIFIQSNVELWMAMKPEINRWFKNTRLGMYYTNRKNGVKILSDKEYDNLQKSGKIKPMIVEI